MVIVTIADQALEGVDGLARRVFATGGLLAVGTAWVALPNGRASRQTRYQVGGVRVRYVEASEESWTELHGRDLDIVFATAERLGLNTTQCQEKPPPGVLIP